ncbi:MAG: hypothetical protein ABUL61_06285, partial [Oleiharenicola lentus]
MKFARLFLGLSLLLTTSLLRAQNAELQNTVIDCEQFDMSSNDTETTSVFTGKVVVTSTNQRLTCDRLEVVALRKGDPKATIGKVDS